MDDDLELEHGPRQHRIRILLSVGAILLVAGGGIYFAQPAYWSWKKHRFQTLAMACLRQGDYRGANLFAQKILAMDSTNVRACRIMASVAEAVHSPDLRKWRQRIAELEPGRPSNQLDLAKLAFVQGDLTQARKALHDMEEAGRQTAAYHEMVALLAAAENQAGLSETHLVEAARLAPGNRRVQFNLAVLHLKTFDEETQEEARRQLEQFSTEARFHAAALRILAQTAAFMHTNDASNALSYSSRLMADPLATFQDRLLHLSLLERLQKQELASSLASLQQAAEQKPVEVYPLVAWMIGHDRVAEALQWLNGLPPQAGQLMPVVLAKAELHAARKDWVALEALLQDSQWGEYEFARLGLLARVAHERKERPARQAFWEGAVRKAGGRLFNLEALLQIARSGRWASEREALLEQITQRFPKEQWALNELEGAYLEGANTRGLHQLYATMLEREGTNAAVKNDLAMTSFLLKINLGQAHLLARQAFEQRPDDPAIASTYAYSLHLLGKTSQGLAVLAKFRPEQLESPGVAMYYGTLLAAAGETDKARIYLRLANRARLLPEEKALVQEATKSVGDL